MPPLMRSLPAPPARTSKPDPPQITSSPASPRTLSFPAPASITSRSGVPGRSSSRLVPAMVTASPGSCRGQRARSVGRNREREKHGDASRCGEPAVRRRALRHRTTAGAQLCGATFFCASHARTQNFKVPAFPGARHETTTAPPVRRSNVGCFQIARDPRKTVTSSRVRADGSLRARPFVSGTWSTTR